MTSPVSVSDRVLALLDEAFADLGNADASLTDVISKATRIARLRGDFDNLHWLEMEQRSIDDTAGRDAFAREIAGHYTAEELERRNKEVVEAFIAERTAEIPTIEGKDQEMVFALPVREIEANMKAVEEMAKGAEIPPGMHTLDVHAAYRERQKAVSLASRSRQASMRVLARIEHRVRKFLSETEKQVAYGQVNADIFERNRQYVDAQLVAVSPQAFEQITAAYRQAQNGGSGDGAAESRSQALLSCRRALKSIADAVFPATGEMIADSQGRSHEMTDDKWRNRLVEFVRRKIGTGPSGEVLESQLDDLGRRFKGLSEASSRGVHADVTEFELNQTVIQTYLTIGDLLRLRADESGLVVVAQGLAS